MMLWFIYAEVTYTSDPFGVNVPGWMFGVNPEYRNSRFTRQLCFMATVCDCVGWAIITESMGRGY